MRTGVAYGWAVGVLLALTGPVRAQTPADTLIPTMAPRPPTALWVLKLAPLSLFDVANTVQFGAERLAKRTRGAWQVEAGYGRGTFALLKRYAGNLEKQQGLETWRARVEYRLYNKRNQRWATPRYRRPNGTYLAFDAFFRQTNTRETGSVGRDCESGLCNYRQYYSTPVLDYTGGGHVKMGRQVWTSREDDPPHWLLDVYVGLGFRINRTDRPGVPADGVPTELFTNTFNTNGTVTYPSLTAGLKLGFAL